MSKPNQTVGDHPAIWGVRWTPETFITERDRKNVFESEEWKACVQYFVENCHDGDTTEGLLTTLAYWNPQNDPWDVGRTWLFPESLDDF